jgi:hypothetical protein
MHKHFHGLQFVHHNSRHGGAGKAKKRHNASRRLSKASIVQIYEQSIRILALYPAIRYVYDCCTAAGVAVFAPEKVPALNGGHHGCLSG